MDNIRLYGADHSPWVQAVKLGFHEKDIDYSQSTVPAPEAFIQWGVMMPAASFDGEPWQLESTKILERVGFAEVSSEDMQAVRATWQGVLHRADYWPRFWGEFSLSSDTSSSAVTRFIRNFFRSFVTLYFFVLITFMRLSGRVKDPDNFGDQFVAWNDRLASKRKKFIGGDSPDSIDLLLFGIVQCHCSNWVPPVSALQSDERLKRFRKWIADMQTHFEDYPRLYSCQYFEPFGEPPTRANGVDQLAFWLGAVFMVSLFWITIPLVALLAYRNKNLRG